MRLPLPLLPTPVRWLGVAAVAGFILYASLITSPPETAVDTAQPAFAPLSYWRHFVAYAALSGALAYAIDDWERRRWQQALLVIAVATLYGAGIEVAQYADPERHFDVLDILVNALGASTVLGWYAVRPSLEARSLGERSTAD
ncbi:VanZ family protein [Halobacteria archaeon AArc-dxtr1]|nr:VanZ family protein [Halobacteria archaeon AArc-dxtr1]